MQSGNQIGMNEPGGAFKRSSEASLLLSAVLDSCIRLSSGQTESFGRCLLALLGGVAQGTPPGPTAISNLLTCFDLEGWIAMLLADPQRKSGLGVGQEEDAGVGDLTLQHAPNLLGLAAALFSLPGGHVAGGIVICSLLGQKRAGDLCTHTLAVSSALE